MTHLRMRCSAMAHQYCSVSKSIPKYSSLFSLYQKQAPTRSFSSFSKNYQKDNRAPAPPMHIFSRQAHHKQRVFSSKIPKDAPPHVDYLREEISQNIVERLGYIMRDFESVAEVGAGKGWIYDLLTGTGDAASQGLLSEPLEENPTHDQEKNELAHQKGLFHRWSMREYMIMDQCERNLQNIDDVEGLQVARVLANEEMLPLGPDSFDLIISGHYLHYINNLDGVFQKINSSLKPDGCFVGAMLGGNSLHELKSCFVWAEHEREGGISPHISPMVGIRDVGNLMASAGFNLPTVDSDEITIVYPDAFTLMKHLQLMGEGNAIMNRRPVISRETLLATAALYDELFYDEKLGGIPATFEIIYMIGWKPHANQPKPKARGSAEFSLKSFAEEIDTDLETVQDDENQSSPDEPIIDDDDEESDDEGLPLGK